MSREKVSVIIPTHNRAKKLLRCIDSVFNQSYKNLEIIIINDGSKDDTDKVVKNFINNDNRIVYIKLEINKGVAKARNIGIKKSTGRYVAFLDDDDEWVDPKKISKQVEIFEKRKDGLGIVCSGVNLIDSDGHLRVKTIKHPVDIKKKILQGNGFIYCPTVMTKRSIIDSVGGFDESLLRGEDSDFYRECIVRHSLEVFFMSEVTANIHEYGNDRLTLQKSIKALKESVKCYEIFLKKFNKDILKYPHIKISKYKLLCSWSKKVARQSWSLLYFSKYLKYYLIHYFYKSYDKRRNI